MGRFETFVYSAGQWGDAATGEQYLSIDVYDSDYATVDYRPAPGAAGRFYLGIQPRDYWEDPAESDPVDVGAEAAGFAAWARVVLGVDLAPARVRPLIAEAGEGDGEDFVEFAVHRLLALPFPEGLGFTEDYVPDDTNHLDHPDDPDHPDDTNSPGVSVQEGAVEVRRAVLERTSGRRKVTVGRPGRLWDSLGAGHTTDGTSTHQGGEGGEDLAR